MTMSNEIKKNKGLTKEEEDYGVTDPNIDFTTYITKVVNAKTKSMLDGVLEEELSKKLKPSRRVPSTRSKPSLKLSSNKFSEYYENPSLNSVRGEFKAAQEVYNKSDIMLDSLAEGIKQVYGVKTSAKGNLNPIAQAELDHNVPLSVLPGMTFAYGQRGSQFHVHKFGNEPIHKKFNVDKPEDRLALLEFLKGDLTKNADFYYYLFKRILKIQPPTLERIQEVQVINNKLKFVFNDPIFQDEVNQEPQPEEAQLGNNPEPGMIQDHNGFIIGAPVAPPAFDVFDAVVDEEEEDFFDEDEDDIEEDDDNF
jgi:hypothetical protein